MIERDLIKSLKMQMMDLQKQISSLKKNTTKEFGNYAVNVIECEILDGDEYEIGDICKVFAENKIEAFDGAFES